MDSEKKSMANVELQKATENGSDILHELEIKDAQIIFSAVWEELEEEYGRDNLKFAKELILLGGAPGAGKGTQTRFILKTRGLTCPPIVVSSLLTSPEAQAIKDIGGIVGDREVLRIVFKKLLEPEFRDGAVLDGFPRTHVQVECFKLLIQKMKELRRIYWDTPLKGKFRNPTVHIMVLFVGEKTSIERQIKRGLQVIEHNREVEETGIGNFYELRSTDLDPHKAKRRYQVFKEQTWDALQSLQQTFHYHFINAEGAVSEVEQNILNELSYQSTLELDPSTYDNLKDIPLAQDIVVHARQDLVRRLDVYETESSELFHKVIGYIQNKIMPIVMRHSFSGHACINTEDELFHDPTSLAMLIDVFSERGYHAVVDIHRIEVPQHYDTQTGEITCREKKVYRIHIYFQGSEIRRG